MKGITCLKHLLEFFEDITNMVNKREPVCAQCLKGIDKVPHNRLLYKIQAHAVGHIMKWVNDWLSHRKQNCD